MTDSDRHSGVLAIGAALDWELRAVLRSAGETHRIGRGALRVWQARCGEQSLFLYRTGVGVDAAARRTKALLSAGGVRCLINTGCAGGLRDDLPAGALFIAAAMIGPLPERDRHLPQIEIRSRLQRAAARSGLPHFTGDLLTSPVPLLTAQSKRQHREAHDAAAVDMESAAVSAVAGAHGVPMASLRAILDTADSDLPPLLAPPAGDRNTTTRADDSRAHLAMVRLRRDQDAASNALEQVFAHFFNDLRESPPWV